MTPYRGPRRLALRWTFLVLAFAIAAAVAHYAWAAVWWALSAAWEFGWWVFAG